MGGALHECQQQFCVDLSLLVDHLTFVVGQLLCALSNQKGEIVASVMKRPYTLHRWFTFITNRDRTDPNYHDWSKYQAKSIKLGMDQFSPLFSQKAEASMGMVKGQNSLGIHLHWLVITHNVAGDATHPFLTSQMNSSHLKQLVLEQAAVVCCLALVTCECHWLSKLYNTFVGTGRDGSLQQFSSLPLLLRSQCLLTSAEEYCI
ncbi:hypothetical protein EMCRGX_G016244 [Ephydatia muelleri]